MAKKKVTFVITKSNWGGAQRYVFDMATALSKGDFSAQGGPTLGSDVSVAYGMDGRLAEELTKAGIATYPIKAMRRDVSFAADVLTFFSLLRLFTKQRPDVVHLNSSKAAALGALAARLAGVQKIIFTVHGWPFLENRNALSLAMIRFVSRLTTRLAHTTIVISQFDWNVARGMGVPEYKLAHISNGIGAVDFLPRDTQNEYMRILTNAELTHNKNLFAAIDSVIAAKDAGAEINYSIMGAGELHDQLSQYIDKRGAGAYVWLLGFVPDGRRSFKNFDIFFLPSQKEGVPYVLLEAGLAELPVVASNVGGIPEVVTDGISGVLCQPTDIAGFADAIKTLTNNKELRARFGKTLREKVERDFSLEQMLQKTIALY